MRIHSRTAIILVTLVSIIATLGAFTRPASGCTTLKDSGEAGACEYRCQFLYGNCSQGELILPADCATADTKNLKAEFINDSSLYYDFNKDGNLTDGEQAYAIKVTWGDSATSKGEGKCTKFVRYFFRKRSDTQYGDYKDVNDSRMYQLTYANYASQITVHGANGATITPTGSWELKSPEGITLLRSDESVVDGVTIYSIDEGKDHIEREVMTANYNGTDEEYPTKLTVTRSDNGNDIEIRSVYFKYVEKDGDGPLIRKRQTVREKNSDGLFRYLTTIYVYYDTTDNRNGKLWFIVPPDGVRRYLEAEGHDKGVKTVDPGDACLLDDPAEVLNEDYVDPQNPENDTTGLKTYASVIYYTYDDEGHVTQVSGNGCGGCGGSLGEGTYTFIYDENGAFDPINDSEFNVWKTRRRIEGPGGLRKVQFLNSFGCLIYEVVQNGSEVDKVWITHKIYYDDNPGRGQVKEVRYPSACKGYSISYITEAGKKWVTGIQTVDNAGDDGLVRMYGYHNGSGNLASEKVRNGTDDTNDSYWVRKYTYTSNPALASGLVPVYRVWTETEYPEALATETNPRTTTYSYTYDGTTNTVVTEEVSYPAVSTENHGSNSPTLVRRRYVTDTTNNLHYCDLTLNEYQSGGDAHYSYVKLGTGVWDHGQVTDSTEDINALPTGVTLPQGWPAVPQNGLNLTTSYKYYDSCGSWGQLKSVTRLSVDMTVYAYLCQKVTNGTGAGERETTTRLVTLVAPHMDSPQTGSSHYDYAPVQITVSDLAGRTVVSAAGTYADGDDIDLEDGDLTNDWDETQQDIDDAFQGTLTSMSVNNYNSKGQLTSSDRYYDITGDGKLTTSYTYDDTTGRQLTSKSPDDVITYTVYDALGRLKETWIGTDATNASQEHPDGGTPPTNDLKRVSATFYDEEHPGEGSSGVGDGLVTSSRQYSGTGSYQTVNNYDYRGRLVKTLSPGNVTVYYDLDNLGRAEKVRTFQSGKLTDGEIGVDSIEGDTRLRAQSETKYDERGQVYQSIVQEVNQSTGSTTDTGVRTLVSNTWYDARGRLFRTVGPDEVRYKTVYDGAGRVVAEYVCYLDDEEEEQSLSATEYVYDAMGRLTETKVGAEIGSTETVSITYYDTDHGGENGDDEEYRVTWVASVMASDDEEDLALTQYVYDPDTYRLTTVISPDPDGDVEEGNPSIKTVTVYDDLGRAEEVQTLHDTTQISKVVRTYDGTRLDTVKQYGSSTDYLTTTYDYDGLGRNIKVTQPSGAFTKTKYDLMGRTVATYLGTEAGSETGDFETALADDTIIEQTEYEYDPEAPRVWLTAHYQRHPDDTGENATPGALAYNTSRANYVVTWFDGLGRTKKTVNYGTYDGAQLDSQTSDDLDPDTGGDQYYAGGGPTPNSPTAGGSKLCIVTTTAYDGFGRAYLTTDNAGREMKILFDDAGRKEYIVEHYVNFAVNSQHVVSGVGGTNNDEDRVTQFTYNKLGLLEKQIALNATSSLDQETRYIYAFEMGIDGCEIPRPELLLAVIYPDSDDTISGALGAGQLAAGNDQVVDRVSYTYYCNGALKTASDQRGVVHTYSYDFLNRLTDDAATTCPSGVDGTVIKIRRAYDNNGRLDKVTSLGASDVVRNEIEYTYNAWGEVTKSEQSHAGAVGSAPSVEYGYDTAYHSSPNAKYVRLRSVTYPGPSTPNRRAVYYNYETVGEFAPLNRVAGISNAATSPTETYAAYSYLGAGAVVKVEYPEVEVSSNKLAMKYWSSGSTYPGLDSMGRVIDQKWAIDTTVKDQFKYAYDGSSNRLSRDVAPDMGTPPTGLDHYYTYDGLDRLTKSNRGTLVDGTIADGSAAFNQAWPGLDALGNWTQFKWDTNGGGNSWTEQSRAHNKANEIAGNSGNPIYGNNADWIDPAYDLAGNMIAGPKPGAETTTSQLYIYDAWNRLVEVQDSSENIVAQYRYDGRHQRIRKYVAAGEDWTVTEYYYNGNWQVIETRQAEEVERTGTPILEEPAVSSTVHEQYVWGIQYIDAPIVRFRDADTLYYTYDAQFNVTALVGTDGVVKERYAYDPYGKVTVLNGASDGDGNEWTVDTNGSDYDNQILYCGYRYDPESGLYHVRYRYYHPTLGRWTTRDPAGYVDGANLYEYVRSNPIGYLDWEGLQTGVSIGPAGTSSADKIFDSLSGLSDEELANKIAGGGATAAATEAIGNLRSTIAGQGSVKIVSRSTEGTILESSESNPELRAEWYKNVMAGTGMKDAIKHRYVQSVASGVDIHIDGGQVQRDSDESVHYVVGKEPQMNLSKSGTMNATLFGPETNGFFIRYDMSIRSALSEGKTSKRGESGACVEVKGFKFAVQDEMKEGVDFDYGVNAGIGKISLKTGRVTTTVSTVGPVGFYIRSNMDLFSSDEEWKAAMPKGAKISYYVEMFLGADGQQFIKAGDFPYTSNWGWQGKDPITGAKWYRAQEQNTTLTTQWIQMKGETSYAVDNWNSVQQRNGNR